MGNKLYVGNLPYSISEEDLKSHFQQYGEVASVKIVTDRDTGRAKGFGFIEMGSDEEAKKAINGADGQDFSGRPLKVNEAKPQESRSGGGGGRGRGGNNYGGGRGGRY